MRPVELTDLQVECLTCAVEDPNNAAAQHLLRKADANGIDGVLAAIFVARGVERSLLLAIARQAIASHRADCEGSAPDCAES